MKSIISLFKPWIISPFNLYPQFLTQCSGPNRCWVNVCWWWPRAHDKWDQKTNNIKIWLDVKYGIWNRCANSVDKTGKLVSVPRTLLKEILPTNKMRGEIFTNFETRDPVLPLISYETLKKSSASQSLFPFLKRSHVFLKAL